MKISIITISFNATVTIEKTLQSVANQSYKNIEHIIVDGGSSDSTLDICHSYSHVSKIISEPDKGVYDAFNKGLKLATGNVVGFLNADDVFFNENAVQEIVNAFSANKTDIVYGNLDYVNEEGKVVRNWISKPYEKGLVKKAWMPAHPTYYCKKEVYDRLGGYNDSFKIGGDFELCLRFLEVHEVPSFYLNKKLVKMLVGGISNSGLKSKWTIYKEELRAFRLNKISVNPYLFFLFKLKKISQFF
ncbi:MAG: glycosyltransferase [Flavobacteriaceae bacterium]|nr:glycosyltransferase [Flavobacteriaceae bacterium]MCI5087820.1 glycosyltransferase [Flavobacteriaceae bacterium]